jgi:hypothetical protein
MILTPALIMALITIIAWTVLDWLFYEAILPGWTLSEGIRENVKLRPWLWRCSFIVVAGFLYWHLMFIKP